MPDEFEQYRAQPEDEFEKYRATPSDKPEMVDTFLGKMPRRMPEFELGSPENKALINEMIGTAAMGPGMKVVGAAPDILSRAATGGYNLLKKFISNVTRDVKPYEEAAQKAGTTFQEAERAAEAPKVGQIIEKPVTELEQLENEIGKHVNVEGQHDVRIASSIKNHVKSIEDYWSNAYKAFEDKVKDAEFFMPEKAMEKLEYDPQKIMEKLRAGADPKTVVKQITREATGAENPFYKELISNAPTTADRNAGDFLGKYRDFRDALGGLKQDLKSEKYGSIEKKQIKDAIERGKEMESQIKDTLNEGLGEFKPEWDWINKGYSEQVFPLRKNPLVKAAKKGKLSSNVMQDLRTNESGMPLLREVVKRDPELLRNVVGQRYRLKPSEIHAPNETVREYLDEMPEFKDMIQRKEKLLEETAKRKDISLKEKVEAEKKLKEIQEAKSSARKKLGYGVSGAVGAMIGVPVIKGIGRAIVGEMNE